MTAVETNQSRARERFLLQALAVSLAVHLLCFATWKWGQGHGWWLPGSRPHWMQVVANKLLTPLTPKIAPKPKPLQQEIPLVFVDTDPAAAIPKPPPDVKYYAVNNTAAANTKISQPSPNPNIDGHQDKIPKATDSGKSAAQPLQPSPKQANDAEERAAQQPRARASITPGDLVMAKPRENLQTNAGKAEIGMGDAAEATPEHHRPRTLEEARQQRGMTGDRLRQTGGVSDIKPDPSFAAMGTSYGDYDREFIQAVHTRWDQLLASHPVNTPGRVVVEFRLLPSGRVTDVKITENTVNDVVGVISASAITDPAPYRPWPRQMQIDLGADFRDVRFTFYYEPY